MTMDSPLSQCPGRGKCGVGELRHPAKFSTPIVEVLKSLVVDLEITSVLDVFSGVGGIHAIQVPTFGVEIEPLWARQQAGPVVVGDATRLPIADNSVDAVMTSPVYGNRMSDHHQAKDLSRRNTYTHALGRQLSDRNAGKMKFPSRDYEDLHRMAWTEACRVSKRYLIVNCSDFIAKGNQVRVCDWHKSAITAIGMKHLGSMRVATRRNKFGANAHLRVDHEEVMVFSK